MSIMEHQIDINSIELESAPKELQSSLIQRALQFI